MKTITVLATGESLYDYLIHPLDFPTIGVNNIQQFIKTDYIICVDLPKRFPPEKLKIICESDCRKFYSPYIAWLDLQPHFKLMPLNKGGRSNLSGLDDRRICYSNNSAFVAVVKAYKKGAKRIIIYGADFLTHQNLSKELMRHRAVNDFINLHRELNKRGVDLFVGSKKTALYPATPLITF